MISDIEHYFHAFVGHLYVFSALVMVCGQWEVGVRNFLPLRSCIGISEAKVCKNIEILLGRKMSAGQPRSNKTSNHWMVYSLFILD